jgi:hypothetical protein
VFEAPAWPLIPMKETSYLSYRRLMGDNRVTIIYREIGLINLGSTREKQINREDGGNKYCLPH